MNKSLYKIIISIFTTFFLFIGILSAHAETYTSTVKKVVDGDTIYLNQPVLGQTKVRLLSIDTPETNFQGKNQGKHAYAATAYLKKLLPSGRKITIELEETKFADDGRLLGHIYKDRLNINKVMIEKGYAVTYFIFPNFKHFGEYQSALLKAKNAGLGIWNPTQPLEELPFVFRARIGHHGLTRWIGDSETRKVYPPNDYKKVPVERRMFFKSKSEATEYMKHLK
ncbi:thermonuclease family protein [Bacillus cereus]|uniref:thermonuclease family protein n=1 Tax=Bacillus cereus TaxID=1396 RepID=UPI00217CE26F|nr:thermonuclease family protein [Bacillus cereus]MCS6595211.1 thermonuclease family protein [Bacillus cereus]